VIGDDRQGLDAGARQAALLGGLLAEQEGKIGGRTKRPFSRYTDEVYAAMFITCLKLGEQRSEIGAVRQTGRQRILVQRFGGGEEQGFEHAQVLHGVGGSLPGSLVRALGVVRPGAAEGLIVTVCEGIGRFGHRHCGGGAGHGFPLPAG